MKTLALCAHALLTDKNDPLLPGLFETFEARKQVDGDRVWWTGEAPTVTYSRGQGADVELTGLLAQAYMRYGAYPVTIEKALNYLAGSKDGSGNFGSTQATVQALKAFSMAAGGASTHADATVQVSLNDSDPRTLLITDENSDILFLEDLQEHTVVGENRAVITFDGEGSSLYQIVGRYYLPWETLPEPGEELISIDVAYDKTELAANDTVVCQVRLANNRPGKAKMVVADIGIPPGFSVVTGALDSLVGDVIQKYQVAGRQLILYLAELDHNEPIEIQYPLIAKFPIRAKTPESVVYEYYNPEIRGVSEPQSILVME